MMNSAPPPAAERLAEAKRELKQVERQIEVAAEHRRQCLLQGSAKAAAAVSADRSLADLKLWRARLADQIELLPPLVMREESEAAWPTTAAQARTKLQEMRARLVQLQSKKKLDRSAADDAEIDSLIPGCGAMTRHAEFLEQFEANSQGTAVA
jgi:BMFP domain-containing protein YqiC